LLFLIVLASPVVAQEKGKAGVTQKQQEKIQAKKAKEEKKLKKKTERKNRRHHLSIQSKDVRKRMRKNTKRSERSGSGRHRDPFYKRIFKSRR